MKFADNPDTRTTHEVRAFVDITEADVMQDESSRYDYASRKRIIVLLPFRPERAQITWRWSGSPLDEWVMTGLTVSGPNIKADGTDGLKTRSVSFIRGGEVSGDTPVDLLNFAAALAPTSKVVSE